MPLEPILPTAIRWGCATTLIGPLVLYSLLVQINRWTPGDLAIRPYVLDVVLTPYLAFRLPLMILVSPFVLLAITWSTFRMWFAVTAAYFMLGALLPVGIDRLVALFDRLSTPQAPKRSPETSEAIS